MTSFDHDAVYIIGGIIDLSKFLAFHTILLTDKVSSRYRQIKFNKESLKGTINEQNTDVFKD
jgi:hypothetical protein